MDDYREILLERLTINASLICLVCDTIQHHPIAKHLSHQLVRSGTASSLIYAESISAESVKDLIHKLALVQKELRETKTNLTILSSIALPAATQQNIRIALEESDELLAQISKGLYTLRIQHRQYLCRDQ
jgi:four helix bundle protein